MGNAGCPRCGSAVALHDGRPSVTGTGAVELWHRACYEIRDQPIVTPAALEPPPVRYARASTVVPSRARLVGVATAVGVIAVALVGWATAGTPSAAVANIDVSAPETTSIRGTITTHEIIPPRVVAGADEFVIP